MTAERDPLKGFTEARLSCGCRIGFRAGVDGSPVLVMVERKASTCPLTFHVEGLAVYDHREALRPSTRPRLTEEEGYEEEG
ncbi:MAG: hypothetical protein QGI02_01195 [Vicinamibacterales bacterium]|jgi:hypothetical protein|nr:hypothetical protein [Vicinamibacterales bacterium]